LEIDEGDFVKLDEAIASLETGKAAVEIKAPCVGKIVKFHAKVGQTVLVGNDFAIIDETQTAGPSAAAPKPAPEAPKSAKPDEKKEEGKKIPAKPTEEVKPPAKKETKQEPSPAKAPSGKFSRVERRVPLSMLRQTVSNRLKESQNTYAMLTTFNECDMSAMTMMRKELLEEFKEAHGTKLGFMSGFIKASVLSLQKYPTINAVIQLKEIVYRDYCDISVAVSSPKGLVVPVLKNCESLSFAELEKVLILMIYLFLLGRS
jgi:2-oxoglutarate dehydrogenase E2 component (dihydrolipoamide succinyltransferase)